MLAASKTDAEELRAKCRALEAGWGTRCLLGGYHCGDKTFGVSPQVIALVHQPGVVY